MPYIDNSERDKFADAIDQLSNLIENKGQMNYVICELVGQFIVKNKLFSYSGIVNAIEAVHDAEIELRRRIQAPWEAGKILCDEELDSFRDILLTLKLITGKKVTDDRKTNRYIQR